MRILSSPAAVLTLALAVAPHDAVAQDRRTHWGVSAGFAPRWTASATWVERLYAADTIDWAGGDVRVGVVRGSDLGGDWGVAFVKRSLEDGGVYDNGRRRKAPVATSPRASPRRAPRCTGSRRSAAPWPTACRSVWSSAPGSRGSPGSRIGWMGKRGA